MSNLTERQRLILTIAATVLVAGGLLALILKDRSEIDATREEIASLDGRIRAAESEIAKIKPREDKVLVYRAVEDRELEILPTKQEIANFHRDLSTFLARAGLSFQDLPESTPMESPLAKGIFVTGTTLTCQGDAAALLKFLNMIENDDRLVAVKGLRVSAGARSMKEPESSPQHEVQIHLESYFYNPETKAVVRNKIAGEESRLQEEEIRQAIASFEPERPDTYVLRPSTGRRDPMVDPRRVRPPVDPAELEKAWREQESIVLELEGRVDDIYEKVEQENAYLINNDLFRRDRLAREIDGDLSNLLARITQVDQMKKIVIPALVVRLETLRGRLDQVRGRRPPLEIRVTAEVASQTYDEVKQAFDNGNYSEVATLSTQWSMYVEGKEVEPDAQPIVDAIAALRPRARVFSEFQSIPLRVTGTIVHPNDPARSVALINGRPLHAGDNVDTKGDLSVASITREYVEFAFKGEFIRVDRNGGGIEPVDESTATTIEAVEASFSTR